MSNKIINVNELFNSTSLVTRQAARDLFDIIAQSNESIIQLNFSEIAHASRSFFDELNSQKTKIRLLGKKVEYINLNPNLQNLLSIVENASSMKSSISYSVISDAQNIIL